LVAGTVKRNDVVVFNLPEGDTTINKEEYGTKDLYYEVIRREGMAIRMLAGKSFWITR